MDLYFIIIYRSIVNVIANDGIANVINVIVFDFILTLFFFVCVLKGILDHSIRRSETTYPSMSPNVLKKLVEVYKKGQEVMREMGVIIKARNIFIFVFFVFFLFFVLSFFLCF